MKKTLLNTITAAFIAAVLVIWVGCSDDETNPTPPEKDTTPPTVVGSFPDSNATDVTRSGPFWVLFSETMNEESVEDNLSINPWVNFDTYWSGDTIFITPQLLLEANTLYTITLGTDCADLSGNKMGTADLIPFTTNSAVDETPPTVVDVQPADGATNVSSMVPVEITFSEPMDRNNTESAVVISPDPSNKDYEWEGTKLVIEHMPFGSNQQVTVTVGPGATDLAGNHLSSSYSFSYTTAIDNTRPYLVSASPANNATRVSRNISSLVFTFSEPMSEVSFDNIEETDIDARLVNALPDDPDFNSEFTVLTATVGKRLLPGCQYWLDFHNVTDGAGNLIDNPTLYRFTTEGTGSYYPFSAGNTWKYHELGSSYEFSTSIENYNQSTGIADLAERESGGRLNHAEHLRYTPTVIYHRGFTDYKDDGSVDVTITWDTELPYIKLPPTDYLGQSWSINSTGTANAQGNTFDVTISANVDVEASTVNVLSDDFEATFKDCVVQNLYATIIAYDSGTPIDTIQTHNIMYLSPALGIVKEIDIDSDELQPDTTVIYDWTIQ